MSGRRQSKNGKQSNPCSAAARVITFMVVAFAVGTLVKNFVFGRACEDCLCKDDQEANDCSGQDEPPESN